MSPTASTIHEETVDRLRVRVYKNRTAMGQAAASLVAEKIRNLQNEQKLIRIIFAAAPSQNEFLAALINEPGIDWQRIIAFHLDDYLGLPDEAPQRFRTYLQEHLFSFVQPYQVYFINSNTPSAEKECQRYSELLIEHPLDIACIGIGENGHIAFNDPSVGDFLDPEVIRIMPLETSCRQQQVNDGCFTALHDVPSYAFSVTIPTIMSARYIYCMVPGPSKALAVKHTIKGSIGSDCPATILRRHWRTQLFLDKDSAEHIIEA